MSKIPFGFHKNMSGSDYHAIKDVASYTGLKHFSRSPAHYQAWLRQESEMTDARLIGQGVHMAVLEPEKFETTFVQIAGHRGSKDVKAAVADALSKGQLAIKPEQYEQIRRMADQVLLKAKRMNLFQNGHAEATLVVQDPESGCPFKARPDYIDLERNVLFDIKTFNDASEPAFRKQLYNMKYDWQSALYLRAAGIEFKKIFTEFCNIVVETSDPYSVNIIRVDDPTLERATEIVVSLMGNFAECLANETWPDYADEIVSTNVDIY